MIVYLDLIQTKFNASIGFLVNKLINKTQNDQVNKN